MARIYCDGFPALEKRGESQYYFRMGGFTLADGNFRVLKREIRTLDTPENIHVLELWAIAEAVIFAKRDDTVVSDSFGSVDIINLCKLSSYKDRLDIQELILKIRLRMYRLNIALKWESRDGNPAGAHNAHFTVRKLWVKSTNETILFDTKERVSPVVEALEIIETETPAWVEHKLDYFDKHP